MSTIEFWFYWLLLTVWCKYLPLANISAGDANYYFSIIVSSFSTNQNEDLWRWWKSVQWSWLWSNEMYNSIAYLRLTCNEWTLYYATKRNQIMPHTHTNHGWYVTAFHIYSI